MNTSSGIINEKKASLPKNIFQLTKSSGETVIFDENKLKTSIVAALRSAGIEDNPISNQLVDEVIKKLGEELSYREVITTLDVREAVEIAFLERGLTLAAQKYHDYGKTEQESESLEVFPTTEQSVENNIGLDKSEDNIEVGSDKSDKTETSEKKADYLEVEEIIEPPQLDDVDFLEKEKGKENNSKEIEALAKSDRQAIIHKLNIGEKQGFFLAVLSEDGSPAEMLIHFPAEALSPQDRILLNLFAKLISVSWQNRVSLQELFADQEQLQLQFGSSDQPDSEVLMIIRYLLDWLSKKFL